MKDLIIGSVDNIETVVIENNMGKNHFFAKPVIPWEHVDECSAAIIEVPVGKYSYSYHWHERSEEVFYIVSGIGKLRCFYGEKDVKAGDMLCFPAGEKGAHSLANASDTELLVYIDFATNPRTDIAILPDTNQVMIYGKHVQSTMLDMPLE